MKPVPVTYVTIYDDEEDLDVEAHLDGKRIGCASCTRDGDRLKLADIAIEDEKLRHRGYGTGLLRFILDRADAKGIKEIRGIVTAQDLQTCPGLLAWYERHGFTVEEPEPRIAGDSGPIAKKKISRVRKIGC
jgi:N-acetylglutamate synthase-like GNAT family acetyltransferase